MKEFYGVPVHQSNSNECKGSYLKEMNSSNFELESLTRALANNKLVLFRETPFEAAAKLFGRVVEHYNLRDSYDIQMQLVVHMMEGRSPIDDVAVTVNERESHQIIQAHCEGDSSSPLDLFGLFCSQNSISGGENVLSLIRQDAGFELLKAKEKVIVGDDLSDSEINELRRQHMDAKKVMTSCDSIVRTLVEQPNGKVVVRTRPIKKTKSAISGEFMTSLWDNVTVHDHAFHKHHYELLKYLDISDLSSGTDYGDDMHVEVDSDWAPADTCSGTSEQISKYFDSPVVHKMKAGDFFVFNNKAWSHAVNNWPDGQVRALSAMYA